MYPNSSRQKGGPKGNFPIHVLVESQASQESVELLLNKFPAAARQVNGSGNMALHRAVWYAASVEVITTLQKTYFPAAVWKGKGERIPLQKLTYRLSMFH